LKRRLVAPLIAVITMVIIATILFYVQPKELINGEPGRSGEADSTHKPNSPGQDASAKQAGKSNEADKPIKGLMILGVGPAETPDATNRGFIALRYCFINFNEDYVFLRLYDRHKKEEKILSGVIPGLSQQRSIQHLVKSIQDKDWPQPVTSHATDNSCEHDYVINFYVPDHAENNRTLFQHEVKAFSYTTLIDTLALDPHLSVTGHTIEAEDGGPMMDGDSFIQMMEFPAGDSLSFSGLTTPGKTR